MAQYSYNPKDYPIGPAPRISILWRTDGAAEIVDTDAGRVLRVSSQNGRHGFAIQDVHGINIFADDAELVTEWVAATGEEIYPRAGSRLSGEATTENAHQVGTNTGLDGPGRLFEYVDGEFSRGITPSGTATLPLTLRLITTGSDLAGWATWDHGANQRTSEWLGSSLAAGFVGLITSASGYTSYDISFIGIGTEGDPAPTQPLDDYRFLYDPHLFSIAGVGGIPTLTFPGVTDIAATSARPQVTLTY